MAAKVYIYMYVCMYTLSCSFLFYKKSKSVAVPCPVGLEFKVRGVVGETFSTFHASAQVSANQIAAKITNKIIHGCRTDSKHVAYLCSDMDGI